MPTPPYPDPFLATHFIRRGLFDLSGRFSPGSIRDQVLRGQLLADHLVSELRINSDARILVVGAGVGGVAVVLRLITAYPELGAKIVVIDESNAPLSTLASNRTRTVSPALYDWPALHSIEDKFLGEVLSYQEGVPASFLWSWREDFQRAMDKHKARLQWRPNTAFKKFLSGKAPWSTSLYGSVNKSDFLNKTEYTETFDIVLWCTGNGKERSLKTTDQHQSSGPFLSFNFWEDDLFPIDGRIQIKVSEPPSIPGMSVAESTSVLIVGGGDGGLQDLLRFLTNGESPRAMLNAIQHAVGPLAYRALVEQLQNIEDQAQRRYLWCGACTHREDVLGEWHHGFAEEVQEFYRSNHEQVTRTLSNFVKFRDVRLYDNSRHWSRCYALNRFLVLLCQEYLRDSGIDIVRSNLKAIDVQCLGHGPSVRAEQCLNRPHLVRFRTLQDREERVACNVVVPRIGQEPAASPSLFKRYVVHNQRQLLPYWLPHWGPEAKTNPTVSERSFWQEVFWKCLTESALIKAGNGELAYCNAAFLALVGKPFAEVVGKKATEYWKRAEARDIEMRDNYVIATGGPTVDPSNIKIPVARRMTLRFPILDANSRVDLLGVLCLRNPSAPIDTSLVHRETRSCPDSSLLNRFFESAPWSILARDKQGRVMYANLAYRRVVSKPGAEPLPLNKIVRRIPRDFIDDPSFDFNQDRARLHHIQERNTIDIPPFEQPRRLVTRFRLIDGRGTELGEGSIGLDAAVAESVLNNVATA